MMALLLSLLGCSSGSSTDSGEAPVAPPLIEWLNPADGATIEAGDATCSTIIDAFTLADPAKHSEGAPTGYVAVSVDGAEVLQSGATTFTLTLDAGAHELTAALFYADGDEVSANADRLCEEDDTGDTCAPVAATIAVTVE